MPRSKKLVQNAKKRPVTKTKKSKTRSGVDIPGYSRDLDSNMQLTPYLSNCSRLYARVISNPFGSFPTKPCIPDVISIPSFKFKTQARGIFSIGTSGVGWVIVAPLVASNGYPLGYSTNANFPNSSYYQSDGTGIDIIYNGGPYNDAALAGKEIRLVGCGLRVMYSGSELNKGGRLILYRSPYNGVLPSAPTSTGTYLLQISETSPTRVEKSWKSVNYSPDNPKLLGYQSTAELSPQVQLNLLAYVDGAHAGESYMYEIVQYWEAIGSGLPGTTISHSDPAGLGAVLASIPVQNPVDNPQVAERKLINRATLNVKDSLSSIVPMLIKGAGASLGAYFGGPSGAAQGYSFGSMISSLGSPLIEDAD